MLFIPIYEVFIPYDDKPEQEWWVSRFIWEDFFLFISYLMLALPWLAYCFSPKKLLRTMLIVFSFVNLAGTFMAGAMPMQDLSPLWGMPVYLVVCIAILFYILRIEKVTERAKTGQ